MIFDVEIQCGSLIRPVPLIGWTARDCCLHHVTMPPSLRLRLCTE